MTDQARPSFGNTLKDNIGYGSASLADSITYSFVGVFFLFFLTTVAGVRPAVAGTLIAFGTIWNAVFNPIMGYCSDRFRSSWGRRRPLILCFGIPLGICCLLMMTNFPLPAGLKPVYYGIMTMLFWTSYTGFFVPYNALGAEWTKDYEARTRLRLFASFFNMIGTLFSMSAPTAMVSALTRHGWTTSHAWSLVGGFIGLMAFLSILVTVLAAKEKDPPCLKTAVESEDSQSFSLTGIFKEYASIAALRPMRYLILASAAALVTYIMMMSNAVYFLTYNLEVSPAHASFALVGRALIGIALLPLVGATVKKLDKRWTMIVFFGIGVVGMVVLRLTGVHNMVTLVIYLILFAISTCVYWQLMPSLYYDVADYDIMVNGRNRSGVIMSFQGLVEAIACAFGSQVLGLMLDISGFDGALATQSSAALTSIFNAATVIPVVFLALSAIAIWRYPITREEQLRIREAIE